MKVFHNGVLIYYTIDYWYKKIKNILRYWNWSVCGIRLKNKKWICVCVGGGGYIKLVSITTNVSLETTNVTSQGFICRAQKSTSWTPDSAELRKH